MPANADRPRVALLVESSNAYARGLLTGITQYLQEHGSPWSVYLPETGRLDRAAARLRRWRGDGVLVRAEDQRTAAAAAACECPVVNLSAAGLLPDVPAVHSDVHAEAEAAFAHLWERGFRHLGFCGVSDYRWATWQRTRFEEAARRAGVEVHAHVAPLQLQQPSDWIEDRKSLVRWLRSLPKPVGIFACYDVRGQQILDACRDAGIAVPDRVAVIGVDNDPVRCNLSDPPLSSVAPDAPRVGYLAAQCLSRMMSGEPLPAGLRLVPPLGVVARGSTDALAVSDPDVLAALRYIRAHACENINVKQVLDVVPLSRRALEGRFVKLVGRSPHEQILHFRVERAKQLLCDTELPIKSIGPLVGVSTPEYLSVLFNRLVGMSPKAYRSQHRIARAGPDPVAIEAGD